MIGHFEIGIRYYGKTAAVGKEAVYTSFLVIGVPTVPTGCYYGVLLGQPLRDVPRPAHQLAFP
jgi:hypothetical protein